MTNDGNKGAFSVQVGRRAVLGGGFGLLAGMPGAYALLAVASVRTKVFEMGYYEFGPKAGKLMARSSKIL